MCTDRFPKMRKCTERAEQTQGKTILFRLSLRSTLLLPHMTLAPPRFTAAVATGLTQQLPMMCSSFWLEGLHAISALVTDFFFFLQANLL